MRNERLDAIQHMGGYRLHCGLAAIAADIRLSHKLEREQPRYGGNDYAGYKSP